MIWTIFGTDVYRIYCATLSCIAISVVKAKLCLLAGVKFYLSLILIFHNFGKIRLKFGIRYLNKILLNICDLRGNHCHSVHHLSNLP